MDLRRLATLVASWLVAVGVVVALPVAQLQVARAATPSCCCPKPAQCHCPGHQPQAGRPATLRPCRQAPTAAVAPPLAGFVPAPGAAVPGAPAAVVEVTFTLPTPHPAPALERRAAPA